MKRVSLEPAFILHRRAYRETSFLIELLTESYGRITVLAKGARKGNRLSPGLLQPFTPLFVSWAGRGELMTLTQADPNGQICHLAGECLFAGFYLNELLTALLEKWDPHPVLYAAYAKTLERLQAGPLEQKTLRSFEKRILEELGYGLLPKSTISLHNTFSADKYYRFVVDEGFLLSEEGDTLSIHIFSGKSLLAIAQEDWQEQSLQDAKRLIRLALAPLLGNRLLHSRRLFVEPKEEDKLEK